MAAGGPLSLQQPKPPSQERAQCRAGATRGSREPRSSLQQKHFCGGPSVQGHIEDLEPDDGVAPGRKGQIINRANVVPHSLEQTACEDGGVWRSRARRGPVYSDQAISEGSPHSPDASKWFASLMHGKMIQSALFPPETPWCHTARPPAVPKWGPFQGQNKVVHVLPRSGGDSGGRKGQPEGAGFSKPREGHLVIFSPTKSGSFPILGWSVVTAEKFCDGAAFVTSPCRAQCWT